MTTIKNVEGQDISTRTTTWQITQQVIDERFRQEAMTWIQTFTGRKAEPLNLQREQVCIDDIAHALANKCRFNGHCRAFYSVAQHSVHTSELVERHVPKATVAHFAMAALMHDAAEAYLPDFCRPIKGAVAFCSGERPEMLLVKELETRTLWTIQRALEVPVGTAACSVTHLADERMLATEYRDLMEPEAVTGLNWSLLHSPVDELKIKPWMPDEAEHCFLTRFHDLKQRLTDETLTAREGETARTD